jgi:hypothetical protein
LPLPPNLEDQARDFANRLSDLLNRTICDGIRLRTFLRTDGRQGWVGYQTSKAAPFPGEAIPVTVSASPPKLFLHIIQTLELDKEGGLFLVVRSSSYGVCLDPSLETTVVHFDYDRAPGNAYPLAHVQVAGESSALGELCERTGSDLSLGQLHLPVGGKRYRPSVEDVVEMLVVEGLAQPRDDKWLHVLEEHRERWHALQLKSVVRRDPEVAAEELDRLGYGVSRPSD